MRIFCLKSAGVLDLEKQREAEKRNGFCNTAVPSNSSEISQTPEEEQPSMLCRKFTCEIAVLIAFFAMIFGGAVLYDFWKIESPIPLIDHKHFNYSDVTCVAPRVKDIDGSSKMYTYRVEILSPDIYTYAKSLFVKKSLIELFSEGKRVFSTSSEDPMLISNSRNSYLYVITKVALYSTVGVPSDSLMAKFTMQTSTNRDGPWTPFTFSQRYTVNCTFPDL